MLYANLVVCAVTETRATLGPACYTREQKLKLPRMNAKAFRAERIERPEERRAEPGQRSTRKNPTT